jgi:hypothetical protein
VSNRTLRNIRQAVPATDLNEPAFASSPRPHWAKARDGSSYVHVYLYPRTLDELRKHCLDFGEAVVANVRWSCVLRWLMSSPEEADLRNPYTVAQTATLLMRDFDRVRLGMPRHDGATWDPPAIDFLSPEVRQEAELVAAETAADWANAGKPYLGESVIKTTYRHVVSCPAFTDKYIKDKE